VHNPKHSKARHKGEVLERREGRTTNVDTRTVVLGILSFRRNRGALRAVLRRAFAVWMVVSSSLIMPIESRAKDPIRLKCSEFDLIVDMSTSTVEIRNNFGPWLTFRAHISPDAVTWRDSIDYLRGAPNGGNPWLPDIGRPDAARKIDRSTMQYSYTVLDRNGRPMAARGEIETYTRDCDAPQHTGF